MQIQLAKIESKYSLLEKEKNGLMEMLSSYEKEEKLLSNKVLPKPFHYMETEESKENLSNDSNSISLASIHNHPDYIILSSTLTTVQARTQSLEAEIVLFSFLIIFYFKKYLKDANLLNVELNAQISKLESEITLLEEKIGRGEFNSSTTKVLHLANNPTSEMMRLDRENKCKGIFNIFT